MESVRIEVTEEQRERLQQRGERRGIDSAEEYLQTLVEQLLARMDESPQTVDEEVESKLESLGYL